ncbi:putative pentatricopeptide repeat-containing protein [Cardamine amara subsp. amara]|uniref:Pentatricopeptide repeat-containing protein n=1 Tax=Cardamine amara subsp. amara TaxID=228776 RepID=A0ABD1ANN5_CARAN
MINTYCWLNKLKQAYDLFKDMKGRDIKPDVVTYTVLLNSIPKLDMKVLGVKADVVYYTVLIDQQCKIGDLEEAKRIFNENDLKWVDA